MNAAGGWVRALAPAKVNPFLEVRMRRADGFHELETTLLALELADEIAVRAGDVPGVALSVDGPHASADIPLDERNLAFAAASSVLRAAGASARGLELRVTKHIPSRAGLGGGSSDAAAAMLAAEQALGVRLAPASAHEILARLGSDCVFFREAAATGYARCTGRGEIVETLPALASPTWIVVLTPSCGASTAEVYGALAHPLRNADAPRSLPRDARSLATSPLSASLFNRLEEAALAAIPALHTWRRLFDDHGLAQFRLAGSGSSWFGVFARESDARHALSSLRAAVERERLEPRGLWLTRPAGAGARLAPETDVPTQ